ncbi:MAG: FtsX-like permease family protein [Lachnospiraceae bacterium]|nr:FtsX-like permease family protein [Lachnospiraceae bacterium]
MNVLKKLTIKDLKLNKKRTIVTIIGIILSVALITAVATIYQSFIASLISYEIRKNGNYHVSFEEVPIEESESISDNRNVEETYIIKGLGYAVLPDSQNEFKPYAYLMGFTKGALDNLSINLTEGRFPENENEIVIPTHLKTNGRISLSVGDTITLDVGRRVGSDGYELGQFNPYRPDDYFEESYNAETGELLESGYHDGLSEEIVDTTAKTYTIVGIIERPSWSIEDYESPGYTFVTYMDETQMTGKVSVFARFKKKSVEDAYRITANILGVDADALEKIYSSDYVFKSEEEYSAALEKIQDLKYNINFNDYLISLMSSPLKSNTAKELGLVVAIVCGIIVFTSVFCIKNSFDISITEKIRQYGMLRSVGATKKQIRKNVMYEASILGVIGIPLGIAFGELASFILVKVSNLLIGDQFIVGSDFLVFAPSWIAILAAVLLGAVTIYLSAFRSAWRASKVSPIVSIRNSADIKVKAKKLRSPKLISKIFGIGGDMSYKNLKRNKKKYRTTIISIMVSVLTFVALSSFMKMAFNVVDLEIDTSDYDIRLNLSAYSGNEFDFKAAYDKAYGTLSLDNIKESALYVYMPYEMKDVRYSDKYKEIYNMADDSDYDEETGEIEGKYVELRVPDDESYKEYIKKLGLKYEEVKDKAILADNMKIFAYDEEGNAKKYKARQFDINKGDVIKGNVFQLYEKENDENEISIEVGYVADELPFGLNEYSSYMIISREYYEKLDLELGSMYTISYYSSDKADKLQDDLEAYFDDKNNDVYEFQVENIAENARQMRNLFLLVAIFLYGFIIVISLIGITNIFNTMTTNMELRRKEFAMLKSIGMTSKEFNRMIRLETVFMGTKSLLYGLPIGIALSYLIYTGLGKEDGLPFAFPYAAILISVAAVFLLIAGIMKYSMGKINRQNTIETIRNENI